MPAEQEIAAMLVRLTGDGAGYQKMLAQAQTSTTQAAGHIERATERVNSFGFGMRRFALQTMGALAPLTGILSGIGGAFRGVSLAAQAEAMEIAFGTMLKSDEKGKEMVKNLQKFAAETPLGTADLQAATKILLQFGTTGEQIIPTLRQLGDVTGGDAFKMRTMALAFGQMSATGRLMGQDLLQMINAGFNPLREIARTTGKDVTFLKQEMEKGRVTVDMVKEAFRTATSAGGDFHNGMERASKGLSGLFSTMRDDIDAFLRNIGELIIEAFRLKDVVKAISQAAQAATEWVQSLSPEMKTLVAIVASVAAAVATLALAWPLLAFVATGAITSLIAIVDVLLGPINLIGAAIAALAIVWVNEMGGMGAAFDILKQAALTAWEWVRDRVSEFLEWFQPVSDAIASFAVTAWEKIKAAAAAVWDFLKELWDDIKVIATSVWETIGESTVAVWTKIRDSIRDAILFAEFTLRNFGQVAEYVWTSTKLGFVRFANQVEYFFTEVIPATFKWFKDEWQNIFKDIFNWTKTVFTNLAENIVKIIKNIPALLKGDVTFSELWTPLTEGFKRASKELEIPERVKGQLEKELEALQREQGGALAESFAEFRRQKLEEFAIKADEIISPDAAKNTEETANEINKQQNKIIAKQKEMQKVDAVLFGSAEALSRIAAFADVLKRKPGEGGARPGNMQAVEGRSADAKDRQQELVVETKKQTGLLTKIANKPGVELEAANLS